MIMLRSLRKVKFNQNNICIARKTAKAKLDFGIFDWTMCTDGVNDQVNGQASEWREALRAEQVSQNYYVKQQEAQ